MKGLINKIEQKHLLYFIFFLLILSLFGWNDVLGLRAEEPRRAVVSMEMAINQQYIVPTINNWAYYNKPPFFNWIMVLFFKLFNSYEEWVVRIPSILAYLLTGRIIFVVSKKYVTRQIALLASLFFLTFADVLFYGTVNAGEIDLFYSLLVVIQVFSIFHFYEKKKYFQMFLWSYFFAAIGTLTKGPPSIAFQALTLIPWLVINKNWKLIFNWKHFVAGFMFLGIVTGYFYWYNQYDDGLGFAVRLFKEASQRTGAEHAFSETLLSSLMFPLFLIQIALPWSLLAVFFYKGKFKKHLKENQLLKFAVVFILFNIPLYWFSADHKARYLYMFLPFIAVLLSYFYVTNKELIRVKKGIELFFLGLMVLGALSFLGVNFVKIIKIDSQYVFISIFLFFMASFLVYLYYKRKSLRMLFFICFLLLFRIAFNSFYLPEIAKTSQENIYKEDIDKMLAITNGKAITLTGSSYTFISDASIGPLKFGEKTLTTAPLIAYQIPYYLTKATNKIMVYDTNQVVGEFYLIQAKFFDNENQKVLYKLKDFWMNEELVLFEKQ